jgi:protein-tyrosine-phosphatase
MSDPSVFCVTFVCTGNRARSPLAEAFLRAKTRDRPVRIESFGTLQVDSEPATAHAIAAASKLGVSLGDHRSRPLTGADLHDVDLVVGFEAFHVATAVLEAGARRKRSFLFQEIVSLLGGFAPDESFAGAERARAAVRYAQAERAAGRHGAALSIGDPYGRSKQAYRDLTRTIDSLTSSLAERLFGLPQVDRLPALPR